MRLIEELASLREAVAVALRRSCGRNIETFVVLDKNTSRFFQVLEQDHDRNSICDQLEPRILDYTPLEREQTPGLLYVARGGEIVEQYAA